jgi:Ribbon-helix-helix protein, copG family
MRTTIHLPDELLAEAKRLAARSRTTLTALIEDALRERLGRRRQNRRLAPLSLTTYGTGGVQSGVDLNDSAALLDLMETYRDSGGR